MKRHRQDTTPLRPDDEDHDDDRDKEPPPAPPAPTMFRIEINIDGQILSITDNEEEVIAYVTRWVRRVMPRGNPATLFQIKFPDRWSERDGGTLDLLR